MNIYLYIIIAVIQLKALIKIILRLNLPNTNKRSYMGNSYCGEKYCGQEDFEQLYSEFKGPEIQDIKNQFENLKRYPNQVPDKQFARVVMKDIKVVKLDKVSQDIIKNQIQQNALDIKVLRGVSLPMFLILEANSYYKGQWKHGFPQGYGKAFFEDKSYYQGGFQDGCPEGDGIFLYPDGSLKRGTFKKGVLQGQGKFIQSEKRVTYIGQWVNDKPHGSGIQQYQDGSKYEGNFVHGIKQGQRCKYTWKNLKVYEGGFKEGFMHGFGKIRMIGKKGYLQGNFERSLIQGEGKMRTEKGEYEGNFFRGEMHGKGKFTWQDGTQYVGDFKFGKLDGQGQLFYTNGKKVKGIWEKGLNSQLKRKGQEIKKYLQK